MKSSIPLVTVLIPVYNGEKFLAEAIDSVLNQTFSDFELLIVNDCSTDKSRNIINSYQDKRIRLINNEKNIGQNKSMNRGLKLAKGKYIARLDQDDVSCKDRLQLQIKYISGLSKTILGSWAYDINNNSETVGYIQNPLDNDSIIDSLAISSSLTHSSIFMERKDMLSLGGYSDKYNIAMDWALWIKAAKNNYKFMNIPKYLIGLRKHSMQVTKSNRGKKDLNKEILRLISSTKSFIQTNNNFNAYMGWKYYHELIYILYNNHPLICFYKLVLHLLKFKLVYELIRLSVYHKIIKNPMNYYNVPSYSTKKPVLYKYHLN